MWVLAIGKWSDNVTHYVNKKKWKKMKKEKKKKNDVEKIDCENNKKKL